GVHGPQSVTMRGDRGAVDDRQRLREEVRGERPAPVVPRHRALDPADGVAGGDGGRRRRRSLGGRDGAGAGAPRPPPPRPAAPGCAASTTGSSATPRTGGPTRPAIPTCWSGST